MSGRSSRARQFESRGVEACASGLKAKRGVVGGEKRAPGEKGKSPRIQREEDAPDRRRRSAS
eukprot:28615-Pelagococcus_subviridis.AAC.3